MHDVIQQVLATEAEARRMLEAARVQAQQIIADAQKQGRELVATTRQEARAEAEKLVESAVEGAEEAKRIELRRIAAEMERQVVLDDATRRRAVQEVIRCVCGGG